MSLLALGEDRVWKLKKAVHYPFIDLSTPELRRANAEREVALNRRFAPDVYLGVLPLENAEGAVVDTIVEMRRMPDERRLALLARTADPDGVHRPHRTGAHSGTSRRADERGDRSGRPADQPVASLGRATSTSWPRSPARSWTRRCWRASTMTGGAT